MKNKTLLYGLSFVFLVMVLVLITTDKAVSQDDKFALLKTFKITMPDDYNHNTQLEKFCNKYDCKNKCKEGHFFGYNVGLTDENFSKVSNRLIPGRTYVVKIWEINKNQVATSEECLQLLKDNGVIFTGAQGVSAVWEQKKEWFPENKIIFSFDEKEKLWNDTDARVPLFWLLKDRWIFGLYPFKDGIIYGGCLFGICDETIGT